MTKERDTLLFVDGIDGAGKTSVIDEVVEIFLEEDQRYFDSYEHNVETFPFPSRMPTPEDRTDPLTRTFFHLNDFHQTMRERRQHDEYRIFDRSFVTTMAYQGFGESHGEGLTNSRFEAIFRLGSEALINSDPTDRRPKDVFFLNVRCDPEVAASRVGDRNSDRVGEIEQIEDREELVERLATLQDRLQLCYSYIRLNVADLYPQHRFVFLNVDSTEKDEYTLAQEVVEHLKPLLWPPQLPLF